MSFTSTCFSRTAFRSAGDWSWETGVSSASVTWTFSACSLPWKQDWDGSAVWESSTDAHSSNCFNRTTLGPGRHWSWVTGVFGGSRLVRSDSTLSSTWKRCFRFSMVAWCIANPITGLSGGVKPWGQGEDTFVEFCANSMLWLNWEVLV